MLDKQLRGFNTNPVISAVILILHAMNNDKLS